MGQSPGRAQPGRGTRGAFCALHGGVCGGKAEAQGPRRACPLCLWGCAASDALVSRARPRGHVAAPCTGGCGLASHSQSRRRPRGPRGPLERPVWSLLGTRPPSPLLGAAPSSASLPPSLGATGVSGSSRARDAPVLATQEDHGLRGAGLLPARQGLLQHLPQHQDRPVRSPRAAEQPRVHRVPPAHACHSRRYVPRLPGPAGRRWVQPAAPGPWALEHLAFLHGRWAERLRSWTGRPPCSF